MLSLFASKWSIHNHVAEHNEPAKRMSSRYLRILFLHIAGSLSQRHNHLRLHCVIGQLIKEFISI